MYKAILTIPQRGVYEALRFGGVGTVKDIQKRLEMRREHHTLKTLKKAVDECVEKGIIATSDISGAYKARSHGAL